MFFADNLKRQINVAHVLRDGDAGFVDDGIQRFGTPEVYSVNILPTNSDSELVAFGEESVDTLRIICDSSYGDSIMEQDRVYLAATVENSNILAQNADYFVYSKMPQVGSVVFLVRRLVSHAKTV